jgi:hypothetical protein
LHISTNAIIEWAYKTSVEPKALFIKKKKKKKGRAKSGSKKQEHELQLQAGRKNFFFNCG